MYIHRINPILIDTKFFSIYWYSILFFCGFVIAALLSRYRFQQLPQLKTSDEKEILLLTVIVSVLWGGKLGDILFYTLPGMYYDNEFRYYVRNASFKEWSAGMSFYGGLSGVLIGLYIYSYLKKFSFLRLTDFIAPLVPPGLGLGRIANFVNGELWGYPATVPWAIIFPKVDLIPRHPSQLYEFFLEGIVLFTILWPFSKRRRQTGVVSGLFAVLYATMRFFVEYFRAPNGYGKYPVLIFTPVGNMKTGQLFSIFLFLGGIWLLARTYIRSYFFLRSK